MYPAQSRRLRIARELSVERLLRDLGRAEARGFSEQYQRELRRRLRELGATPADLLRAHELYAAVETSSGDPATGREANGSPARASTGVSDPSAGSRREANATRARPSTGVPAAAGEDGRELAGTPTGSRDLNPVIADLQAEARELCAHGEHPDTEDGRCLVCGAWVVEL